MQKILNDYTVMFSFTIPMLLSSMFDLGDSGLLGQRIQLFLNNGFNFFVFWIITAQKRFE